MQKRLLKNKNFYLVVGYDFINGLASKFCLFCLPCFVYDITQSATHTVFTFGMHIVPSILFSLFGGSMADYFSRRRVLLATNLLSGLTLLGFSVAFFNLDVNTHLQAIYVLNFLLALYTSLEGITLEAAFTEYFDQDELISINTISSAIHYFRNAAGPFILAALIMLMDSKIVLFFSSFLYLFSFVLIKLSKPKKENFVRKKFEEFGHLVYEHLEFTKKGLLYLLRPGCPIHLGVLMSTLCNLFLGAQSTLIFFIAKNNFGMEADSFGVGITITLLIASIILLSLIKILSKYHVFSVMAATIILDALANVFIGLSPNIFLLFAFYCVSTIAGASYCAVWMSFRQSYIPGYMLGRVVGVCSSLAYGFWGLGVLLGRKLLDYMPPEMVLILGGSVVICIGGLAFFLKRFYATSLSQNLPSSSFSSTIL